MLVAWDTRDGDEILTCLNYPWDRCDPMWRSGKVLDRTSRGPGFNSPTGPDFFTISIQCVFVSQCFIIKLYFLADHDGPKRIQRQKLMGANQHHFSMFPCILKLINSKPRLLNLILLNLIVSGPRAQPL